VSPSHGLQFFTNCPSVGPSLGCSPSGTGCSSVGPPWGLPCQQTCSSLGFFLSLSTGPQVLAGAYSSMGFPWGHNLFQASTCSRVGSLPRATGGYLLHSGPPWAAGAQPVSPWSFIIDCRGISALVPAAPPPPPSSLTMVSVGLFLSHHLTPLSGLLFHCRFFPLLKYVIPEVLPPLLMGLGLALASGGSVLEPAGTGFIRHEGSFSQLLTEATFIAPPLPKPCHVNPQQMHNGCLHFVGPFTNTPRKKCVNFLHRIKKCPLCLQIPHIHA